MECIIMPAVGQAAPDFELPNQDGKRVRLNDTRGKPLVLFTFPEAGTMGCTMQACSFRDSFEKLSEAKALVLGISPDVPEDLRRWKDDQRLPFDLLSDPHGTVLRQYEAMGVSLLGLNVPGSNRTLWVIDQNGVIFERHVPVAPWGNVAKAMAALTRLRDSPASV
jgi:thioredoxin-dependent peroxiredoxin